MHLTIFKKIIKALRWLWLRYEGTEYTVPSTPSQDECATRAFVLLQAWVTNTERTFNSERTQVWISGRLGKDGAEQWGICCEVNVSDGEIFWQTKLMIETKYLYFFPPDGTSVTLDITIQTVDMQGNIHGSYKSEVSSGSHGNDLLKLEDGYDHFAREDDLRELIGTLERLDEFTERSTPAE